VLAEHDYFDNLLKTLPDAYRVLGRQALKRRLLQFPTSATIALKLNGKVASRSSSKSQAKTPVGAHLNEIVPGTQPHHHRHDLGGRAGPLDRGILGYNSLPFTSPVKPPSYFESSAGLRLARLSKWRVWSQAKSKTSPSIPKGPGPSSRCPTISLGESTEVAIKQKTLLGAKFLEVAPA